MVKAGDLPDLRGTVWLWLLWLAASCGLALPPLAGVDIALLAPPGGPPGLTDSEGAIFAAVLARDSAKVRACLTGDPALVDTRLTLTSRTRTSAGNLEEVTVSGLSLLHLAAAQGDLATMQILLDAGLRVDDPDDWWLTPLHFAVWYADDIKTVEFLLDHGANIEARDGWDRTPLLLACYFQYDRRESMVVYLLERGANANLRSADGLNAIQAAHAGLPPSWGPLELHRVDVTVFRALYQHTLRIPGWAQLCLYLAALAVFIAWLRQMQRGRRQTPDQIRAEIDRYRVLKDWNEAGTVVPAEQIQANLQNRERYEEAMRYTLVPVTAAVMVTLFVLLDPILPQLNTHPLLIGYAGLYLAIYSLMWTPVRILRGVAMLGVMLLTVFGIFTLFTQGWQILTTFGETSQFVMYLVTTALFAMQLIFVGRASALLIKVQLFNSQIRRAREQLLKAADATGMDAPPGTWDEGKA